MHEGTDGPALIGRRRVLRDLGLAAVGGVGVTVAAGSEALAAYTPRPVTAVNVQDAPYSAKGDGVTDDRAALQLALNDVPTNGGAIYFPPGDYGIKGALVPKNSTLMFGSHTPRWVGGGNPPAATKIRAMSTFTGSGLIAPGSTIAGLTIRNLALVGSGVGTALHGLRMPSGGGERSVCLEDVTIAGFTGSGIFGRMHVANLVNCFLHDNNRWGIEASGGDAWLDAHVVNCFLYYNRSGNLYFGGSGQSGAVDFVNCRFERAGTNPANVLSPLNPSAPGVRIASGRLLTFANCNTDANCGSGFEFVHESASPSYFPNNITLTNCRFNRDGTGNQSPTLGEYAGIKVRGTDTGPGSAGQIKAVNCMSLQGKADDAGGGVSGPKYGVWYENTNHFQWIGGNVDAVGAPYYTGAGGNWRPVLYDVERSLLSLPLARPGAGVPVADGSAYVDEGASRLFVRVGGAWKSAPLS